MKTKEFIEKATSGRIRKGACASVFYDGEHIYSYGYHYPLLVNVAGQWILNDRGYSATTAKHIAWARPYADFHASFRGTTRREIAEGCEEELKELRTEIAKGREGSYAQEARKNRLIEIARTYHFVCGSNNQMDGATGLPWNVQYDGHN